MTRVLIAGEAGFIGSNLVREFGENNPDAEIRVLDDPNTDVMGTVDGLDVDFCRESVAGPDVIGVAAAEMDSIVQLGALGSAPRSDADPIASHAADLDGTLQFLETARKNDAQMVSTSSNLVHGSNRSLPGRKYYWIQLLTPYGVTKLGAEAYTLARQYSCGLPTLPFCFFDVHGPQQSAGRAYATVIPNCMDRIRVGDPIVVAGDGEQSRDLTIVHTVGAVHRNAVERRLTVACSVNLACGRITTVKQLADALEQALGGSARDGESVYGPLGPARGSVAHFLDSVGVAPFISRKDQVGTE